MLERLRARARDARFAVDVIRRTGVGKAFDVRGVVPFALAARHTKVGPQVAVMWHAKMNPDKDCILDGDTPLVVARVRRGDPPARPRARLARRGRRLGRVHARRTATR